MSPRFGQWCHLMVIHHIGMEFRREGCSYLIEYAAVNIRMNTKRLVQCEQALTILLVTCEMYTSKFRGPNKIRPTLKFPF